MKRRAKAVEVVVHEGAVESSYVPEAIGEEIDGICGNWDGKLPCCLDT